MNNRRDILNEIEDILDCPVGSIVYHDKYEIESGDEDVVARLFREFKGDKAAVILQGNGGFPQSALAMAITLKQKFPKKLITLIPEVAASSMSYLWLVSDKAYFGSNTAASQINICFNPGGGYVAPKDHLCNPDLNISQTAKTCFNADYQILETILSLSNCLLAGGAPKDPTERKAFIENLFEMTHKRDEHQHPITIRKFKDNKFNIEEPDKHMTELLNNYVDDAKGEILNHKKRLLVETKIESVSQWVKEGDFTYL